MNATRESFSHESFWMRHITLELVSGGGKPNVFIMPTAKRHDDLIKLLITSFIVLNACARGQKALSQTVDKYLLFFDKFLSEIRKILNIKCECVCLCSDNVPHCCISSINHLAGWLAGCKRFTSRKLKF